MSAIFSTTSAAATALTPAARMFFLRATFGVYTAALPLPQAPTLELIDEAQLLALVADDAAPISPSACDSDSDNNVASSSTIDSTPLANAPTLAMPATATPEPEATLSVSTTDAIEATAVAVTEPEQHETAVTTSTVDAESTRTDIDENANLDANKHDKENTNTNDNVDANKKADADEKTDATDKVDANENDKENANDKANVDENENANATENVDAKENTNDAVAEPEQQENAVTTSTVDADSTHTNTNDDAIANNKDDANENVNANETVDLEATVSASATANDNADDSTDANASSDCVVHACTQCDAPAVVQCKFCLQLRACSRLHQAHDWLSHMADCFEIRDRLLLQRQQEAAQERANEAAVTFEAVTFEAVTFEAVTSDAAAADDVTTMAACDSTSTTTPSLAPTPTRTPAASPVDCPTARAATQTDAVSDTVPATAPVPVPVSAPTTTPSATQSGPVQPERVPTVPDMTVSTIVKPSVGAKPTEYIGSHACVLLTTSTVACSTQQAHIRQARDILHQFGVVFREVDAATESVESKRLKNISRDYPQVFVEKEARTTTTETPTPTPSAAAADRIESIRFSYEQLSSMQFFDEFALLPPPQAQADALRALKSKLLQATVALGQVQAENKILRQKNLPVPV